MNNLEERLSNIGFKPSYLSEEVEVYSSVDKEGQLFLAILIENDDQGDIGLTSKTTLGNKDSMVFEGKLEEILEIFEQSEDYQDVYNHFDIRMLLVDDPTKNPTKETIKNFEKWHLPRAKGEK